MSNQPFPPSGFTFLTVHLLDCCWACSLLSEKSYEGIQYFYFFGYSCQVMKKTRQSKHLELVFCWLFALAVYTLLWKIKAVCWSESCSSYCKMLISKPVGYPCASGSVVCPFLVSVVQHQSSQCAVRWVVHATAAVLSVLASRALREHAHSARSSDELSRLFSHSSAFGFLLSLSWPSVSPGFVRLLCQD